MKAPLMSAEQLAETLGLPNVETVKRLARQRKIPVVRLGYRSHFFDADKCRTALEKLEVRAV